ncbi:MAG: hypothetical protein JO056_03815 [Alphaproteobacteria bacterium]|nr:hypothetical protein [Alphaproteobacteria bacterium]
MRTGVPLILLAIAAATGAMPAAADDAIPNDLVLSGDTDALFGPALMQTDASDLASAPRLTAPSSNIGGFDPSQMRIFGGEIGGEGVQGGAVVSLSWPTQH